MKNVLLLAVMILSSLLFVQCKKSEVISEEYIQVEKSIGSDILDGTSWDVVSLVDVTTNTNISWSVKNPKFNFVNGIVEMRMGRDFSTKEYLCINNKFVVDMTSVYTFTNPDHAKLYDLFKGEFFLMYSTTDPNELMIKSVNETVITLRKRNQLSITSVQ